jgi:hypothetical protein
LGLKPRGESLARTAVQVREKKKGKQKELKKITSTGLPRIAKRNYMRSKNKLKRNLETNRRPNLGGGTDESGSYEAIERSLELEGPGPSGAGVVPYFSSWPLLSFIFKFIF